MNKLDRIEDLIAFSTSFISKVEGGGDIVKQYREKLQDVTPHDLMLLQQHQMNMGISVEEIKESINKILNILYEPLDCYRWKYPKEGTFLYYLMLENRALEFRLNTMKGVLRSYRGREEEELSKLKEEILPHIEEFQKFTPHYLKKEDILFSYIERHFEHHQPLQVMWSIDDDIKRLVKELKQVASDPDSSWSELNRVIGQYYFAAFGMIQKEELILYPVATEVLPPESWEEMQQLSFDYPFPFIVAPEKISPSDSPQPTTISSQLKSSGGSSQEIIDEGLSLFLERAELLFDTLPLDITYVDENNKVRYFNRGEERHFFRSDAVIGRDVKNCHPPESLHMVEKIVESFKTGEQSEAQFWINRGEELILICYFAVRDKEGNYRGVMEVSQEISQLKKIEGERRLLEW